MKGRGIVFILFYCSCFVLFPQYKIADEFEVSVQTDSTFNPSLSAINDSLPRGLMNYSKINLPDTLSLVFVNDLLIPVSQDSCQYYFFEQADPIDAGDGTLFYNGIKFWRGSKYKFRKIIFENGKQEFYFSPNAADDTYVIWIKLSDAKKIPCLSSATTQINYLFGKKTYADVLESICLRKGRTLKLKQIRLNMNTDMVYTVGDVLTQIGIRMRANSYFGINNNPNFDFENRIDFKTNPLTSAAVYMDVADPSAAGEITLPLPVCISFSYSLMVREDETQIPAEKIINSGWIFYSSIRDFFSVKDEKVLLAEINNTPNHQQYNPYTITWRNYKEKSDSSILNTLAEKFKTGEIEIGSDPFMDYRIPPSSYLNDSSGVWDIFRDKSRATAIGLLKMRLRKSDESYDHVSYPRCLGIKFNNPNGEPYTFFFYINQLKPILSAGDVKWFRELFKISDLLTKDKFKITADGSLQNGVKNFVPVNLPDVYAAGDSIQIEYEQPDTGNKIFIKQILNYKNQFKFPDKKNDNVLFLNCLYDLRRKNIIPFTTKSSYSVLANFELPFGPGYFLQKGNEIEKISGMDTSFNNSCFEFQEGGGVVSEDTLLRSRRFGQYGNQFFGFNDLAGRMVIYPQYTMANPFSENKAAVKIGKRWGYIDKKNNLLTKAVYTSAGEFYNGSAIVSAVFSKENKFDTATAGRIENYNYRNEIYDSAKYFLINQKGKEISQRYDSIFSFKNGMALIRLKNKFGFISQKGKEIVPPEYENAGAGTSKLFVVKKNNKWGCVNAKQKEIIPFIYDSLVLSEEEKYFFGRSLSGWEILSIGNEKPISGIFKYLPYFKDGVFVLRKKEGWILCEDLSSGKENKFNFIELKADSALGFSGGLLPVQLTDTVSKKKYWNYADRNGKIILNEKFDCAGPFKNGCAFVFIEQYGGFSFGLIDKTGKNLLNRFYRCTRAGNYNPPKLNELVSSLIIKEGFISYFSAEKYLPLYRTPNFNLLKINGEEF